MFKRSYLRSRRLSLNALVLIAGLVFAMPAMAQDTGGIKGKVRTTDGDGIANASVTARQKGSDIKTVSADSKGNFVLDGLEAGRYNLAFDAPGYSSGTVYNIEVKKKKISDLKDRMVLSTDQGTLVIVRGSVFYREGTSVTGAEVELFSVNADGSTGKRLGSYDSTATGEFTFRRPVGASKLRVKASHKGVSGTKDIEVDDAGIYRLAISLELSRAQK